MYSVLTNENQNMRFPRRRGALMLTRGRLIKMSQERQKLSFFIVVIFLAVFGIIILAEVLSMEEGKNGYGISYEHDSGGATRRQSAGDGSNWETPKPLLQGKSKKLGMITLQTPSPCCVRKHTKNYIFI